MIWMLIGRGPNDVSIPCLWFSTKAAGVEYVTLALGRFPDGETFWNIDKEFDNIEDADGNYQNSDVVKKFYTHYYDGCGECWRLDLVPVAEATPFVEFDLD